MWRKIIPFCNPWILSGTLVLALFVLPVPEVSSAHRVLAATARFAIERTGGLASFSLPILLLVLGAVKARTGSLNSVGQRAMVVVAAIGGLFTFTMLLCNTPLSGTRLAGFFPLLAHCIVLSFSGSTGHATAVSLILESLLFLAPASYVVRRLVQEGILPPLAEVLPKEKPAAAAVPETGMSDEHSEPSANSPNPSPAAETGGDQSAPAQAASGSSAGPDWAGASRSEPAAQSYQQAPGVGDGPNQPGRDSMRQPIISRVSGDLRTQVAVTDGRRPVLLRLRRSAEGTLVPFGSEEAWEPSGTLPGMNFPFGRPSDVFAKEREAGVASGTSGEATAEGVESVPSVEPHLPSVETTVNGIPIQRLEEGGQDDTAPLSAEAADTQAGVPPTDDEGGTAGEAGLLLKTIVELDISRLPLKGGLRPGQTPGSTGGEGADPAGSEEGEPCLTINEGGGESQSEGAVPTRGPRRPSVLNLPDLAPRGGVWAGCIADVRFLKHSPVTKENTKARDEFIRRTAEKLEATIRDFGIESKVVNVMTGPVITRYELTLASGVKISRVVNLADNIALSLAAPSVRIVGHIPGKNVIGIEIPNDQRQNVFLRDVVDSKVFRESRHVLPIALGKSILGEPVVADLAGTPHLLVAGATGSGKSVCVNAIITSLLFKLTPRDIRFIMIDPKMVELTVYNDIPHLLTPVITDPKRAAQVLRWVISEMEARYALLERHNVRSIGSYNNLVTENLRTGVPLEDGVGTLPYIVVIIDEFADLMMVARKEVEDSVIRLAAMSRAVGIHLILATQRPSVDVITGIIKANFPSRIAFQVSSKVDSRTILDGSGADKLLGKGDMLFQKAAAMLPERIQGAFLSDEEVNALVEELRTIREADYLDIGGPLDEEDEGDSNGGERDDLFNEAMQIVIQDRKASASYLQRKLKIGYNRAARIVEDMERLNLVGAADGAKPREVLVSNWREA